MIVMMLIGFSSDLFLKIVDELFVHIMMAMPSKSVYRAARS